MELIKASDAIVIEGLLSRYLQCVSKPTKNRIINADRYCMDARPENAPGAIYVMKLYERSLLSVSRLIQSLGARTSCLIQ